MLAIHLHTIKSDHSSPPTGNEKKVVTCAFHLFIQVCLAASQQPKHQVCHYEVHQERESILHSGLQKSRSTLPSSTVTHEDQPLMLPSQNSIGNCTTARKSRKQWFRLGCLSQLLDPPRRTLFMVFTRNTPVQRQNHGMMKQYKQLQKMRASIARDVPANLYPAYATMSSSGASPVPREYSKPLMRTTCRNQPTRPLVNCRVSASGVNLHHGTNHIQMS